MKMTIKYNGKHHNIWEAINYLWREVGVQESNNLNAEIYKDGEFLCYWNDVKYDVCYVGIDLEEVAVSDLKSMIYNSVYKYKSTDTPRIMIDTNTKDLYFVNNNTSAIKIRFGDSNSTSPYKVGDIKEIDIKEMEDYNFEVDKISDKLLLYPKLMLSKESRSFIVYFTNECCGTVVGHINSENNSYEVGFFCNDWAASKFEDYNLKENKTK